MSTKKIGTTKEQPVKTEKTGLKRGIRKSVESEVAELPTIATFPSVRKGSKETGYITLLQANLKNRGYYNGLVDGKFEDRTEKAVKEFQKDCGKPLSGSVGPKTWELLQNSNVYKVSEKSVPDSFPAEYTVLQAASQSSSGVSILIEGLTRYQADLLIKLLQGHTECRIV